MEVQGRQFDSAVTSYGVQLKNWIDLQVDARLNVVLQGALNGQMAAFRQESARTSSDMEVLKRTQAQLLSVVENISEEVSRMKSSTATFQMQQQSEIDACRKWVEDSQARFCEDLLATQQRAVHELRNETTAACRAEAAARAALDEQLWLTDQRLTQRINELDKSHHETITVINRANGTPDKVVSKHFVNPVEEVEENTIHIRPPPPFVGASALLENGGDAEAVYVERTVRSPGARSPGSPSAGLQTLEDQVSGRIRLRRAGNMNVSESPLRAGGTFTLGEDIRDAAERSRPSGRLRLSGT